MQRPLAVWSLRLLAAASLVTAACGDSDTATSTGAGGEGGAGGDPTGGAGGGEPTPVIDPSLFDCTRVADPERTTSVPISCATDPTCSERLVSGHRGAGGSLGVIAPEDTVAGVLAAIALGVDYVETDPRPTQDGYLVNLHDTSVDRTTDGTGEAADLTLAEIQALTLDTARFPGDFSCERVPTLEEILTAARGKVHVLVDANKTDRVDLLVQAIQTTDTLEWAIFDTSSVAKIDEALLLEPSLLTMIRVDTTAELDDQIAHFADHPPVIVEIGASPSQLIPAVHAHGHRAMLDLFGTDYAAATSNDPSLYGDLFDLGLDIGQTDRPDLVLTYLGRFP